MQGRRAKLDYKDVIVNEPAARYVAQPVKKTSRRSNTGHAGGIYRRAIPIRSRLITRF
jgi:hypothetical protein